MLCLCFKDSKSGSIVTALYLYAPAPCGRLRGSTSRRLPRAGAKGCALSCSAALRTALRRFASQLREPASSKGPRPRAPPCFPSRLRQPCGLPAQLRKPFRLRFASPLVLLREPRILLGARPPVFGAPPAGEARNGLPEAIRQRLRRCGGAAASASAGGASSRLPFLTALQQRGVAATPGRPPRAPLLSCTASGGFCRAGGVVSCAASPRRRHKNSAAGSYASPAAVQGYRYARWRSKAGKAVLQCLQ